MSLIKPFQNAEESATLDELTIENGPDRIAIYGSLNITRDKQGLEHAQQLKALIDEALKVLTSEKLPEQVKTAPAEKVENPFKS